MTPRECNNRIARLVLAAAFSVAFALALAASTRMAAAQEPAKPAVEPSVWMKQKLKATEAVLEGLTSEDYAAISANAGSMLAVGYLETFVRADTPGYRAMMADFRYANRALMLASKEKNLDGATIAYVQLTLSCVNCHSLVRDAR